MIAERYRQERGIRFEIHTPSAPVLRGFERGVRHTGSPLDAGR